MNRDERIKLWHEERQSRQSLSVKRKSQLWRRYYLIQRQVYNDRCPNKTFYDLYGKPKHDALVARVRAHKDEVKALRKEPREPRIPACPIGEISLMPACGDWNCKGH